MKIGIVGYGRMGKQVQQVAEKLNIEVSAIFDIDNPLTPSSDLSGSQVLIDFSLANAVPDILRTAASLGVPVVEGTTGWYAHLQEMKSIPDLTMLYSPNFSIGVYLFMKLTEYAAQLYGSIDDYDCYIHEWHHRGKADSPSGTAKKLADILLKNVAGKDKTLFSESHGKIPTDTLHVTSTRVGRVPGTHEIGFDSEFDAILLRHQAHGREGFAYGAVKAAEWLKDKKGIYTMDDFMNDLLQTNRNER